MTFHPEIACGGEWTQHVSPSRKLRVAEESLAGNFAVLPTMQRTRIEQAVHDDTRWLGFKLLFRSSGKWFGHPRFAPALWLDRFGAFLRWIANKPDLHVIHIVRKDPIEWLKSKYLADTTRSYTGKTYPEGLTVQVPVGEALRRLSAKNWIDHCLARLGTSNPYLCVSYEEFLESNLAVVFKLMAFLDCDTSRLREFDYRRQKKQSRKSASDYIANYPQLVAALENRRLGTK
jgi:hypothetical protein